MNTRFYLGAALCGGLATTAFTQSVGLQASLLDPLYGAGHLELSVQPVPAVTVDVAYGQRFETYRPGFFGSDRHRGSVADIAVMYSGDTDPGPKQHLLQVGMYYQQKHFTRFEQTTFFAFGITGPGPDVREEAALLGVRAGYKYVAENGFTCSVHGGLAGVLEGETRRLVDGRVIRGAPVDRTYQGAELHFLLRLKLGYTFRWGNARPMS